MKALLGLGLLVLELVSPLRLTALPGSGPEEAEPMSLEKAIQAALQNSRELRYSLLSQKIASEKLRLSARRFFPELEVGISRNDSVLYGDPDSRLRQVSFGIRQLLFDAGRTVSGLKLQSSENKLGALDLRASREELIYSVILTYIELLCFKQKKDIDRGVHQTASLQQRIAQEEVRLGVITELDLLDIALGLKNIELELEKAEEEERLLLFKLARLTGSDPAEKKPVPVGTINEEYAGFTAAQSADYWLKRALENNLELLKLRARLAAQQEALAAARLRWLPEITGSFSLFFSGVDYPLTEPGFNLGLQFSFQAPFLPLQASASAGKRNPQERSLGYSASGKLAESLEGLYSLSLAKLNLQQARGQLEEFEMELKLQIQESLFTIENQKKILLLLREKLTIGQRRMIIQRLRLELGELKRIDFLNEEVNLGKLRVEVLNGQVTLYKQEVALLKLCGLPGALQTGSAIIRGI